MELRKAKFSDFESFYSLRSEDTNIRWAGHREAPVKENLEKWFTKALENPKRDIYLYWDGNECLGYLYVDVVDDKEREIAYGVSQYHQGKGYASSMIMDCIQILRKEGVRAVRAAISESNVASEHVAIKNGLEKTDEFYYSNLPLICGKSKFYIWERTI